MNPTHTLRVVAGLTQARLASAAGTSQPAIAAYESGAKSPTWRTVERVAASVGLVSLPFVGMPMTRDQSRSLSLHGVIAAKLMSGPPPVIAGAKRNVAKMLDSNAHAAPLVREWARILELSPAQIASQMLDPSEHGRDLRQVTPFAGVLTAQERAAAYRAFREAA